MTPPPPADYRQTTLRLADQSEAAVLAVLAAGLVPAVLAAVAAGVLAVYLGRAVALADLGLAAALSAARGRLVLPLGLPVPDERPRLAQAVATILDEATDTVPVPGVPARIELPAVEPVEPPPLAVAEQPVAPRLVRLARAEPLAAGRVAYAEGMRRHGVTGWVRQTGPTPCPRCARWADGIVRPPTVRFFDHPGCACVARIVYSEEIP